MQMKNNKGITLMSLIVTAIVLIILAGVSFMLGTDSIETSKTYILESSVKIVATAVVQQRGTMESLKINNVPLSEDQPESYVGTPIDSFGDIRTNKLNSNQVLRLKNSIINFDSETGSYKERNSYDDLYYRVSGDDFTKLGISNEGSAYIVNYKTGEVYNETIQATGDEVVDLLFYVPTQPKESTVDNTFAE